MRYFKLVASSVSAQRNKVYYKENKDLIPENAWLPGKADELVRAGFIQEHIDPNAKTLFVDEEKKVVEVIKEIPLFVPENKIDEVKTDEVKYNLTPIVEIGEITKDNIKLELANNNIEFDVNANKKVLYDLWVSFAR